MNIPMLFSVLYYLVDRKHSVQQITDLNLLQVSNQLNKLYMKFLKRNPGYSGKVCSSIVHNPFTMFFIIAIMLIIRQEIFCLEPILQVSLYGHSLGSVLSYDILCHQESLWAPFPTEYLNMETSDRSQGAKSPSEVSLLDSGAKRQDTSTVGHSCTDNENSVDEDSTKTDVSRMDSILPSCVLEDSPNNHETVVPCSAVVAQQNEEDNKVENHQSVYTEEGTTSGVSTKDAEGSSISRSAEEVHEEVLDEEKLTVLDKDKLISSLEEEV